MAIMCEEGCMRKSYPTDVSDKEWTLLEPLFFPEGAARKAGRVASVRSVRECYNAIRYVLKTGCQWRMLPVEFPPKSTVHDAFTRWTADGLWPRINEALRPALRLKLKKTPSPARPSSTAKASNAPIPSGPAAAATMRGRKSKAASAIS